jgi:hypothetical protein
LRLTVGDRVRLELELPRLVAASALLVGVILCRRSVDELLRAVAGRLRA